MTPILPVTILLLLAVLLFVGYPLAQPLSSRDGPFRAEAPLAGPEEEQRSRLLTERENALSALKDLELEHSIGNLSDADYAALHSAQRHKALTILRELDRFGHAGGNTAAHTPSVADDFALDTQVEEEIARARQRLIGTVSGVEVALPRCPACGSAHAPRTSFCPECGHHVEVARVCPVCGLPRTARDRFCAGCGASFEQQRRGT